MPINARQFKQYVRSDSTVVRHLSAHGPLMSKAADDDGRRAMLTVPVDGDELHITYRETAANLLACDLPVNQRTPAAVYAELLAGLVVEWDLLDERGEPWPLSRYSLEQLPKPVLAHLWEVLRDIELDAA